MSRILQWWLSTFLVLGAGRLIGINRDKLSAGRVSGNNDGRLTEYSRTLELNALWNFEYLILTHDFLLMKNGRMKVGLGR
jgi:hypothetical protein